MIKFKIIYQWSFYVIILLTFLIGGALQFLLNFSNTILTLFLSSIMFTNYVLYVIVKNKIKFNFVIISFICYVFVIITSSIFNKSDIISTCVYLIFAFLPLSVYLFFTINKKEGYISQKIIYKSILTVALIQFPIILFQENFYNYIILLKNNSQHIAYVDFQFGSFMLKSDHSLGCFLLLTIISLIFNFFNIKNYIKYSYLIAIYLSLTILISESNITKLLLVITWGVFFLLKIRKIVAKSLFSKRVFIVLSVLLISLTLYNLRNIEYITSRVGGVIDNHFTPEKSVLFFEKGTAKREQIVIAAATELKPKIIGEGPYYYFDIKTGKFKNTIHFSQLIWTYFDLGLIGLGIVIFYVLSIVKSVMKNLSFLTLLGILFITFSYMFYALPMSDIGIMISLIIFFAIKPKYEFNDNTIS